MVEHAAPAQMPVMVLASPGPTQGAYIVISPSPADVGVPPFSWRLLLVQQHRLKLGLDPRSFGLGRSPEQSSAGSFYLPWNGLASPLPV